MAAPLPRGAPYTANLGGDREEEINKRHYSWEGCVWGPPDCTQEFPPFTTTSGSSSGRPLSGMRLQVSSQLCSLGQRWRVG